VNARFVPWIFLAPALATLGVFFALPVLAALVMSFTDLDLYALADPSSVRFVGFGNYLAILNSGVFWQALRNTAYFVALGAPLSIAVSLGAALMLHSKAIWARPLFRLGFFLPVVTTMVAVAVVWRYVYHPTYGLLNQALGALHVPAIDWLGSPTWAMPALILMAVWKNFGYNMLIFLAGLGAIPDELYEAARLDGATRRQEFFYVTLPQLVPTTTFVTLMTVIGYGQFFAEPFIMTHGGPLDQTLSVVLLMYREGFRFWRMGYATALAFTLFAIIFAITLVQQRLSKEREA
jgi:multiple sugar transport system permease protein